MKTLIALAALVSLPAHATSDADLRALIEQASRAVDSPAADADRDAAADALRRAIAALEGEAGRRGHGARQAQQTDACVDLGVKAYAKTMYAAPALEKALDQCRAPVDAGVVAIAFPAYLETMYDGPAFEAAVEIGRRPELFGKSAMLQQATAAYRDTMYARSALEQAADLVGKLPREADACVRRSYATYRETTYARTAIEKAAAVCTE
ncbi:MAG: hypothetical protein H6737_31290 [Alphaproteobacteria bacterium]|nr:hypothetical protein [Alphaproteobacteria bacterium]